MGNLLVLIAIFVTMILSVTLLPKLLNNNGGDTQSNNSNDVDTFDIGDFD